MGIYPQMVPLMETQIICVFGCHLFTIFVLFVDDLILVLIDRFD